MVPYAVPYGHEDDSITVTNRCQELLAAAKNNPAGLRFAELQRLCECVGMTLDRTKGSHFIYHHENPSFSLSIQETRDGKAKPYQVRELLALIEKHNLDTEE